MKEKQLTPGTVYPVLGNLLFFLPQRYKEKLCCVTPLAPKVTAHRRVFSIAPYTFVRMAPSGGTHVNNIVANAGKIHSGHPNLNVRKSQ